MCLRHFNSLTLNFEGIREFLLYHFSFFLKDLSLLNCLFSAVRSVILRMFHKINKSKKFTPGIICVLHTFGRFLQWNPHIHCLVSEGGVSDDGFWRKTDFFSYTYLRNAFCTALLNMMETKLGPSFKAMKGYIYKHCKNGFYIWGKPNLCDPKTITKYIGRYLGRLVTATSRIDAYDGEYVTYHYNRHEDNKLYQAVSKEAHKIFLDFNRWRTAILSVFGYDPLKCPHCGKAMLLFELYYNHKPISLQELYERSKAKHL